LAARPVKLKILDFGANPEYNWRVVLLKGVSPN